MAEYSYRDLFSRNIGVFTEAQQMRIKDLRVAIAGCGGVGSPVAVCLARLGVGEIRVADPDDYEASNVNRQFGAYPDTVGRNKAGVIGAELSRINPHARVVCLDSAVTADNCEQFLRGVDCVVDAVDFFRPYDEMAIHRTARGNGQWVFTALQAGSLCVFTSFRPDGISFDELFCPGGKPDVRAILETYFPLRPKEATPEMIRALLAGEEIVLPFLASITMLVGGFLVEDIIRCCITGGTVLTAPDLYVVEPGSLRISVIKNGTVTTGGV